MHARTHARTRAHLCLYLRYESLVVLQCLLAVLLFHLGQLVVDRGNVPDALGRVRQNRLELLKRLQCCPHMHPVLLNAAGILQARHVTTAQTEVENGLDAICLHANALHVKFLGVVVELGGGVDVALVLPQPCLMQLAIGLVHQRFRVVSVHLDRLRAVPVCVRACVGGWVMRTRREGGVDF